MCVHDSLLQELISQYSHHIIRYTIQSQLSNNLGVPYFIGHRLSAITMTSLLVIMVP